MNLFINNLKDNWKSGVTVSLVSIPLSVSLAIAAGSTPVAGIITAIWAGLFASFLGGSNFNIVGPTGALSGILAVYAFTHGAESLALVALVSGIIILISWFLKLERYLVFIPANTIQGFTLGVAFIIGMNQFNSALGLTGITGHERFIDNVIETFRHLNQTNISALIVFVLFFIGIYIVEKYRKGIPVISHLPASALFAVIGIGLGFLAKSNIISLNILTLGDKYTNLTAHLFQIPHFTFSFDKSLIIVSLTVALISIIETMLSARIADSMTKTKHHKRKEMFGLGVANVVSGVVGGIPATAALARTSLNIKSGATHKSSGVINSVCVAVISLFLLPYFKYIPMAVIAAVLVTVAVRMIEKEHFERMFHIDKKSFAIAMIVAFITIYEDPIVGILVGAAISLLLFLENLSHGYYEIIVNNQRKKIVGHIFGDKNTDVTKDSHTLVYSIKGQFTYINSQAHVTRFDTDHKHHKNIILRLRELSFIDLDGVDAFEEIVEMLERRDVNVYVAGANQMIAQMLSHSKGFRRLKKEGKVFDNTSGALRELGFKL